MCEAAGKAAFGVNGGVNPGARYATAGLVPRDYRLFPVIPGYPRFGVFGDTPIRESPLWHPLRRAGFGGRRRAARIPHRRYPGIGDTGYPALCPPPGNIGDRDYSPRGYMGVRSWHWRDHAASRAARPWRRTAAGVRSTRDPPRPRGAGGTTRSGLRRHGAATMRAGVGCGRWCWPGSRAAATARRSGGSRWRLRCTTSTATRAITRWIIWFRCVRAAIAGEPFAICGKGNRDYRGSAHTRPGRHGRHAAHTRTGRRARRSRRLPPRRTGRRGHTLHSSRRADGDG